MEKAIILFDGYCNFCSGSVMFIIRRDPGMVFRFAASQSDAGQEILKVHGLGEMAEHSIILIRHGIVYKKSAAALRIARQLRNFWPMLYGFIIIPGPVRDIFYDIIARNRYRIAGKRNECFLPDNDARLRFL